MRVVSDGNNNRLLSNWREEGTRKDPKDSFPPNQAIHGKRILLLLTGREEKNFFLLFQPFQVDSWIIIRGKKEEVEENRNIFFKREKWSGGKERRITVVIHLCISKVERKKERKKRNDYYVFLNGTQSASSQLVPSISIFSLYCGALLLSCSFNNFSDRAGSSLRLWLLYYRQSLDRLSLSRVHNTHNNSRQPSEVFYSSSVSYSF